MKFAAPHVSVEFQLLPHELRQGALDFDSWMQARGHGEVTIVDIHRTPEENERVGGVPTSLHLDARAIDFRNREYSAEVRAEAEAWLLKRFPAPVFERVLGVHGTGPHWHIGQRRVVASPPVT